MTEGTSTEILFMEEEGNRKRRGQKLKERATQREERTRGKSTAIYTEKRIPNT